MREPVNISNELASILPKISKILNGQYDENETTEDFNS